MNARTEKKIQDAINRHPTFSKVADFIAQKHGIAPEEVRSEFVKFLERENFSYDSAPRGVLCFLFDGSKFVNRTKVCYF